MNVTARFLGSASTANAVFLIVEYDSNSHPGRSTPAVREGGTCRIAGELYEVDDDLLARLDEFEQVGRHYFRKAVVLEDGRTGEIYLHLATSTKQPHEAPRFVTQRGAVADWREALGS